MTLMKRMILLLSSLPVLLAWSSSPYHLEVSSPHHLQILLHGPSSLEKRLQIIEQAERTIELEYFIYDPEGFSTKVLTNALIQKAKEGVHVRILIDSFRYKLDKLYTHFFIPKKHLCSLLQQIFYPLGDISPLSCALQSPKSPKAPHR